MITPELDLPAPAAPADIHVSIGGDDANEGSAARPFRTISAAARAAQPGDVVTVHAGTYRERVDPPRGGTSDIRRIVYQAAPGESVEIKGSEVVKGWEKTENGVWSVSLPNSFFGDFNPYTDRIHGDWFTAKGRRHHTGAVYLDGVWLSEAASIEEVRKSTEPLLLWFAEVDAVTTTLWARFGNADPNGQEVEINVRRTVFYPGKTGVNFLTVRGFTMRHAATPWAPPTAEQVGLIGTNWSKGWIIENNTISHSMCCGITLGKYGDAWDNTSVNSAEGYDQTIARALLKGWNRETIGSHIVRHNTISDCEQGGIIGSLGAIFSQITDNHIYNIWSKRQFEGAEMAGIKIHAAIDALIKGNRIHSSGRGIWLDWMAQGARVTGNLCYDNSTDDLFMEVNHGPYVVDNNIFLSELTLRDWSEGGAFAHNLFRGRLSVMPQPRRTPCHLPHSTSILNQVGITKLDNRFYNNIFIGAWVATDGSRAGELHLDGLHGFGLWHYAEYSAPLEAGGNVYYTGARPFENEKDATEMIGIEPGCQLVVIKNGLELILTLGEIGSIHKTQPVATALLGLAAIPQLPYLNPDGSALTIDTDYFGSQRDPAHPSPGPFENPGSGRIPLLGSSLN